MHNTSHEAAKLLHMHKYQRALDVLEVLVVAHVFELGCMNHSQTGMVLLLLISPCDLIGWLPRLSST
jgi:hypothetical protein